MNTKRTVIRGNVFKNNEGGGIKIDDPTQNFDIDTNEFSDNGGVDVDIVNASTVNASKNTHGPSVKKPKRGKLFAGFSFAKGDHKDS